MIRIENLSRRGLLKGAAASGLALGLYVGPNRARAADGPAGKAAFEPNVYVALDTSGAVTITIGRSEMGQGIKTSLATILADEMAADWEKVSVRQADGDPKYGDQNTDGSRSIRLFYAPLRLAGATARQMIEAAAAQTWHASLKDCRAVDHRVIHVPTGRELHFGDLAKLAAAFPIPAPDKVRLKDASSRRYIGHPMPMIDQPAMVRGKAIFGSDIALPGMRHASIERCPVYGGKVRSYDPKDALAVRGVERVIEIPAAPTPTGHLPLGGIAVIANTTWAAIEGRKRLKIEWDRGPNATHDSAAYRAELEATVRKIGRPVRNQGNAEAAIRLSGKQLTSDYFVPYQAHVAMEPPVATAHFTGGKMTIWAPTQDPQGARSTVAKYLGLKDADVTVKLTLVGGGFGRNAMHDFVCEAAWLSKTVGVPVKVTWTREDDIRHDYYHAISEQHLEGGVDKGGAPFAWRHRCAFPSINATFQPNITEPSADEVGQGMTDNPYSVLNLRCETGPAVSHVRIGWYRSVMNIPFAFAICSFIDEMAELAGKDPGAYIYTFLAGPRKLDLKAMGVDYPNYGAPLDDYPVDIGRLQSVLQLAMDRSGWGDPLLARQGRGIAVHRSFCSYVAAVAVVMVGLDGHVTVERVDVAVDCGLLINPDRIRAQMEGSVIFGLGLTLFSNLTIKDGAVEQSNFDNYMLARMNSMPVINVYLVPSTAPPSGAGEPAVPVIAPAICNAIFSATGKRIRSLPVDTTLLRA